MTDVLNVNKEIGKKRNIFEKISKEKVVEELEKIVGKLYVTDKPHDLYPYSYDMTEADPLMPDIVVLPGTTEEISDIVKLCNDNTIPIVPYISGNNVGALTLPEQGGIICDMGKRMKKIIAINESMRYAIIEPGVTFGEFRKYLDDNHPDLKYAYPLAPPYASVAMNALLAGETNIPVHGTMADWINGLEVVLNDGDIVRTGSCFISKEFKEDNWFYRQSIPDLTGLFICWQGMTGIVTKCAVQLWPKLKFNTALAVMIYGSEACAELQHEMGRSGCLYDLSTVNIGTVKMILDKVNPVKFADEPDWIMLLSIEGQTKEILEAKVKHVKDIFEKFKEKHTRIFLTSYYTFADLIGPIINQVYDLPHMLPLMYRYNGITWVGSYANPDNFAPLMDKCMDLYKTHDLEPFFYMKSMKSGHYGLFRVITRYDKNKDLEKVKTLQNELLEVMLDYDCVPDKIPVWVAKRLRDKCDPNWFKLLERVKKAMDPNNIFNPGKMDL